MQLPLKIIRQLALDCVTRWNSTHYMLQTFLLHKRVFLSLFDQKRQLPIPKKRFDKLSSLELNTDEWEILSVLYKALEPFAEATNFLSGSQYPTIGLCLFAIRKIKEYFDRDVRDENPLMAPIRSFLSSALNHYFDEDSGQFQFLLVRAKVLFNLVTPDRVDYLLENITSLREKQTGSIKLSRTF